MGSGEPNVDGQVEVQGRASWIGSSVAPAPVAPIGAPSEHRRLTPVSPGTSSRRARTPAARRFRSALIDLCFERGFAGLTVEHLCRRAGLGRTAFERHYVDLEDCFFQVCRGELQCYHRRAADARAGLRGWRARLRATAYALYRFLEEDERRRRFMIVEGRAAGERSRLLIAAEIQELVDLIDEGRAEPTAPSSLTRVTAESVAGGIFHEVCTVAAHGGPMPREEKVVPELMYLAVLPYLGPASAAEELVIPAPRPPRG